MQKQTSKKSKLRKLIDWLHLWPGLISSLLLIFVCLTGTIVVFCDEIIDFANREVLHVPEVKANRIPAEELLQHFRAAYPTRRAPSYFISYRDPSRSVKFNSYDPELGLSFVYMDPYTGKVLKEDRTIYFFFIMAHLHNSLMLGKVGAWIVDIATIIFLIALITGIVLWWPKKWNKKGFQDSFTIRWKARFQRLNLDLHNVLGFYTLGVALVLTVTGLIIAFQPLAHGTISLFGGDPSEEWKEALTPPDSTRTMAPIQPVLDGYLKKYPEASAIQLGTYFLDKQGYYMLNVSSWVGLKNYVGEMFFVDKYTGQEIAISDGGKKHEAIENMWWMLHMGSWMGLTGKILTFITGLVATSLPVTGFLVWWGKQKKKWKKGKKTEAKTKKSSSPSRISKPKPVIHTAR